MADETDFEKARATLKADMAALEADAAKAKAWYSSHLFYAGCVVGAAIAMLVRHFL